MSRLLLLPLLALVACDSAFEAELPAQEPRLVIEALFAADSLLTLQVHQSASVLDGPSNESVTGATVEIFEDGVPVGTATYVERRLRFVSGVRPRAGRTYRLRVSAPGFATVEAEDTVPLPPPFTVELVRGETPTDPDRDRVDRVTVRFSDPMGADYYALYGISEMVFDSGEVRYGAFGFGSTDPIFSDGNLVDLLGDFETPFYGRALFESRTFDGQSVAIGIDVRRFRPAGEGFRVVERLRLARLSETYYRYVTALENRQDGTPFSEPRALPSNVEGGYGIFAAFAAAEQVLPE